MNKKFDFKYLLLIVLPALFVFEGLWLQHHNGPTYTGGIDPEYTYLFNALNIAQGKLKVGHIDHPGTPVQVIGALVIRITNLTKNNHDISYEVLSRPEYYINLITNTISLLNGLALVLLGVLYYRRKKDLFIAVALQSLPFIKFLIINTQSRLIPEALLPIPVFFIFLIITIRKDNEFTWKDSVWLGLITSFGTAIKLTFLPFFLFTFFILKTWKNKLVLSVSYLLGFMAFAFPVIDQWVKFRDWVIGLFIHSGKYGGGEKNIVDPESFSSSFRLLLNSNKLVVLLLVLSIVFLVIFWKKYKPQTKNIVIGGWVFFIFQFLFVAKHFAFHYIIPAIMLPPFVLLVQLIAINDQFLKTDRLKKLYWVLPLLIVVLNIGRFKSDTGWVKEQLKQKQETIKWVKEHPFKYPILNVTSYSQSPHIVAGLWHGLAVSGKYRLEYSDILEVLYPNTYYVQYWSQNIYDWHHKLDWEKDVALNDTLVLYKNNLTPDREENLKNNMIKFGYTDSLIYSNKPLGNEVHLLTKSHD